jgi:hypothetical protein
MATINVEVDLCGVDVEVEVEFKPGWFQAGNRRGHPDNWEPDEGENAEIDAITLHLQSGGSMEVTDYLEPSEIERIQAACDRYEVEPDYPEPDEDYYDEDPNVDCGTDNYGFDRECGNR